MSDEKDDLESIVMTDEDGNDVEFMIIDQILFDGNRYILVVEKENADDEEPEATILKELENTEDEDDITYVRVIEEFDEVVELFSRNNKDYDLEIDE